MACKITKSMKIRNIKPVKETIVSRIVRTLPKKKANLC